MPRCKAGEVLRNEAYLRGTPQMGVAGQPLDRSSHTYLHGRREPWDLHRLPEERC